MFAYRELKKTTSPCPVCGGGQFRLLASNDRYGMGVKTTGCLQCGLVQTWPRPTPDEISAFYRNSYRHYYQASTTPNAEYVTRFHKNERLTYTAGLITSQVGFFNGMRVLDVGCAEGTLLNHLKSSTDGATLVGVEPSESFAAYAREITGCITYPDLKALIHAGESNFDLAIVNHVLEHVDNPVEFLRELRTLLSPGGSIYIDVPDVARYSRAEDLHIAHLFHFSAHTLVAALEKAGYWVVSTVPHAPPHHPNSIYCLAERRELSSDSVRSGMGYEVNSWKRVREAGRKVPLYRLKHRLRNSWFATRILHRLKAAIMMVINNIRS